MNTEAVLAAIQTQADNIAPLGASIKFKLDDQAIMIDGKGDSNVVSTSDEEADCTVSMAYSDFIKLRDGELNPMMAVMTGKIKVKGDMSLAMKLQSLLK